MKREGLTVHRGRGSGGKVGDCIKGKVGDAVGKPREDRGFTGKNPTKEEVSEEVSDTTSEVGGVDPCLPKSPGVYKTLLSTRGSLLYKIG